MKWLAFILLYAVLLGGCSGDGIYSGTLILEGDHRIESGRTIEGELFILGGNTILDSTSRVNGSLFIMAGRVVVNGEVGGNITLGGGTLALGPESSVVGRVDVAGGVFEQAPGARVEGGVDDSASAALQQASSENLPPGTILQIVVLAFLAWLAVRLAPGAVSRIGDAIQNHPLPCLAMGILGGLVGLVLPVSMAFTLVLIPVALLTGLFLLLAIALGWIGIGALVGRSVAGRFQLAPGSGFSAFLGTVLFMLAVTLLGMIPQFNGILMLFVSALGLGAVLLTRIGSRRFVPAIEELDAQA